MKESTYCRVQFQNLLASYSLIAKRSARYNNTHLTGEEGIPCTLYILYIHLAGLPLDVYVEGVVWLSMYQLAIF